MADTPSWLQGGNDPPAAAPAPASASAPVGSMNVETGPTAATASVVDEKDLPSVILMMRLLNMGVASALIAISVRHALYEQRTAPAGREQNTRHGTTSV